MMVQKLIGPLLVRTLLPRSAHPFVPIALVCLICADGESFLCCRFVVVLTLLTPFSEELSVENFSGRSIAPQLVEELLQAVHNEVEVSQKSLNRKKNPTLGSHDTLAPHTDSASLQLRNSRTSLSVECDKSLVPHDDLVSLQVANSKHFLSIGIFSDYSKVNKDPTKVDEKIVQEHRLRLEERLRSFNVVEHQVVGDGYCQYRSLSYLLFDTDDRYLEVKEQAIQQIINDRDTYQIYLLDEDFDLYLNRIRSHSEWGDGLTLRAAADYYGVRMILITSQVAPSCYEVVPTTVKLDKTLMLSYFMEMHYNPLKAIEKLDKGLVTSLDKHADLREQDSALKDRSRKPNEHFSVDEMIKIVDAVGYCGVGKWKVIKSKYFSDDPLRSPQDIRCKWRNLVDAAKDNSVKRGLTKDLSGELLDKVRVLEDQYRKRQANQPKSRAYQDPNKPKKSPTAFFLFMEDFRKSFKQQNPNNKSVSVVAKAGGEMWKSLNDSVKDRYKIEAENMKQEYSKQMEVYNRQQGENNDCGDNVGDGNSGEGEVNDLGDGNSEEDGEARED